MYSANGYDKSMFLYLAPSLLDYLTSHYDNLREGRYQITLKSVQT